MERSTASNTLRRGRAKALAPPTASRRRCYNQAAYRGQASQTTDARAAQRERAWAAQRRLSAPHGPSGTGRRASAGAKRRRQAGSGGRSRCRRERGKDAGVATGEHATGSDPGEWSCSDDESPEAAVSAEPSRLRPQRMAGAEVGAEHRSSGRSRSCYPSWPWPASGRCGVSPLEWGGRDADSTAGKGIFPNNDLLGRQEAFAGVSAMVVGADLRISTTVRKPASVSTDARAFSTSAIFGSVSMSRMMTLS